MSLKILLLERDPGTASMIQIMLELNSLDAEIVWVSNLHDAWSTLYHHFDVVFLEWGPGKIKDLETLYTLPVPLIALSATDDEQLGKLAIRHGAQDVLIKNEFNTKDLRRSIVYSIERYKALQKIKAEAMRDGLTGLYNKTTFGALADQQLKAADRSKQVACLLYMDMNNLKKVNDQLGHARGDEALKAIANCLQETFRSSDIIGRLGGDEFGVLALDMTEETARGAIERMNDRLSRWEDINIILSTGIVLYTPGSDETIDTLLETADNRMYGQKRQNTT